MRRVSARVSTPVTWDELADVDPDSEIAQEEVFGPVLVVIKYRTVDEAIEIAKRFGSEHGHTYVNGVLDRASADWRAVEVQAGRNSRG